MKTLRRIAGWLVWHGPRLPVKLAQWLFAFSIGAKNYKRIRDLTAKLAKERGWK